MIRYSYSELTQPIDVEEYCEGRRDHGGRDYWRHFGNPPRLIRNYEKAIYNSSDSNTDHCIKNVRKNLAIVHFHIATSANDLINKIVKTPRVTYADILSNIGTS